MISPRSDWMRLPRITGWGASKDFPRPAGRPFRANWAAKRRTARTREAAANDSALGNRPRGAPAQAAPRVGAILPTAQGSDPIDRFIQELQAVGGQAHRVSSRALQNELVRFLRERSFEAVAAWDHIDGLDLDALKQAGFGVISGLDASLRAGITACACAIAETGTLVLTTGAGRPLTTSLLPEVHVAIVRADQIVWTLEEALSMPEVRQSSATVLVTGPSRTADIEMTLTIGVHGPGELVVYILE